MQFFLPALGVAFITLKLMGYITWSWFWVTSPLWIMAVITLLALAFAGGALVLLAKKGRI